MDNKLVFGYWGIRGIAQPIRYLLEYLGLPYEEKKYFTMEEWFQGDFIAEPFKNHNLVNLPYLKDGDKYIYESGAIYVYLAHKANKPELLGKNAEEQVLAAQCRGLLQDIIKAFSALILLPEEEYKAKSQEKFKTDIGWLLERLNKFLEGRTYVTGDNVGTIDFGLFELEETLKAYSEETFNGLAHLKKHHATFSAIPQITAYMESNRFQARPFYPPDHARWG